MLVPAISRKDELERLFAEHLYNEDMFLYNGYPYCNQIPDLTPRENEFKWAIVDKENVVVGYFCYYINNHCDSACSFGLYSFKRDSIIGFDVYKKMKELVSTYHRVEWRMIGGNPVQKHYDRFCKRHCGNRVVLYDAVKSPNGEYQNEYVYEIVKGKKIVNWN